MSVVEVDDIKAPAVEKTPDPAQATATQTVGATLAEIAQRGAVSTRELVDMLTRPPTVTDGRYFDVSDSTWKYPTTCKDRCPRCCQQRLVDGKCPSETCFYDAGDVGGEPHGAEAPSPVDDDDDATATAEANLRVANELMKRAREAERQLVAHGKRLGEALGLRGTCGWEQMFAAVETLRSMGSLDRTHGSEVREETTQPAYAVAVDQLADAVGMPRGSTVYNLLLVVASQRQQVDKCKRDHHQASHAPSPISKGTAKKALKSLDKAQTYMEAVLASYQPQETIMPEEGTTNEAEMIANKEAGAEYLRDGIHAVENRPEHPIVRCREVQIVGSLGHDLMKVLNAHSTESLSNTSDSILAEYMLACLDAFNMATIRRDKQPGPTGKGART